ncbi:hypothetical protein LSTR_LSTR005271 [Laodelphax striatellus]|uniref:Aminopeptidase n=1 Tax=Laodelphax striatellus TaxID=195883 RepID=A0A482X7D5_LAOST|nr:hypothetical protein LSTR_LSTR005271 [Laodelphax striatellus]
MTFKLYKALMGRVVIDSSRKCLITFAHGTQFTRIGFVTQRFLSGFIGKDCIINEISSRTICLRQITKNNKSMSGNIGRRYYMFEDSKPWETQARLPPEVVPETYDILLNPDLKDGKFSGRIKINLKVLSERKIIVLHANELTVSSTKLVKLENASSDAGVDIPIAKTFNYPANQYFVIISANLIQPGSYVLTLDFSGSLTGKIVGFYRSTYKDVTDGTRKSIATTKFEPTYARSAFPCFDEPSFKAEFIVSLVKPSDSKFIALSNMNVVKEEVDQPTRGSTLVHFAKSVPMSTYLACFIVCDFDKLESVKSEQGFPVSVYGRRGQVDNLKYALDLAVSTINYYIKYFGINYPLPKLDLIAIPDFVSGAMENWGLITFRETSVFFNPEVSSPLNKDRVAMTVTHELAHMWFGNLATMKWWDDLWLNEGFASYIEFKGVNHSHPDWDMDTQFLSDTLHPVLRMDSVVSSHPIVKHVAHPDQITEIFDMISYNKGASVIRMLEDIVGADNFQRGVSDYLRKFSFKNAVTQDLWNSIAQYTTDMDISKIMDTYTRQMGLPVVTITQEGNRLTMSQSRFLADKNSTFDESESDFKYKWEIPLTYVTSNNPSEVKRTWLHLQDNSTSIDLPSGTKWVKFNLRQKGYYRVNYSPKGWEALSDLLLNDHEVLSAADRASLLDDAFSLASAGYLNYKTALNLLKYISKESHFVPLQTISLVLSSLDGHLRDTPVHDKFKKFVQTLLEPLVVDSMWNGSPSETFMERRKRIVLFSLLSKFEIPSAVSFAHNKFTDWLLKNGTKPEVDVRGIIFETAIKNSSKEEWDKLWQIYLKEDDPQESSRLRNTLVASRDSALIERLIELGKDENNVRSQDYIMMLASISHHPVGNKVVWKFVRDHWSYLVNRFTLNDRLLGRLIPAIAANYGSEEKLQELKDFFAANPESGAGAAGRKIALEKTQNNINWLKSHVSELAEAL